MKSNHLPQDRGYTQERITHAKEKNIQFSWRLKVLLGSIWYAIASAGGAVAEPAPQIQPIIQCPQGYWQSNSTTVPFCVNQNHDTYRNTPVCFLTDTCNGVTFKDIKIPLSHNSKTLLDNWNHYEKARGNGPGLAKIPQVSVTSETRLSELWPGLRNRTTTWGVVAQLACTNNQCGKLTVDLAKKWNFTDTVLAATLNWAGLASIFNQPRISSASDTPLHLTQVPAKWLADAKSIDVVRKLNLWEQTLDKAGYSQPTTEQAGMVYAQMLIISQGSGNSLHGIRNFTYDNRLPSDQTPPGQNPKGGSEEILTGSNRFVKNRCQVSGGQGQGYNNCAHLNVRQNQQHMVGNRLYILVSGEQEKLSGKGGGDLIVKNTRWNATASGGAIEIHNGEFRGTEHVGATNDEPLLPQGSNVERGLMLDQCQITEPIMATMIKFGTLQMPGNRRYVGPYVSFEDRAAKRIVPSYATDPCTNRYRRMSHTKTILTMDARENYLVKTNRTCSQRQIYHYLGRFPQALGNFWDGATRAAGATTNNRPVIACNSINKISGNRTKIERKQPIPWPLRGGLMSKQE